MDLNICVGGSNIFKCVWKGWKLVTHIFHGGVRSEKTNILCKQDSIWWNLKARDKPLALVQGCSTKK